MSSLEQYAQALADAPVLELRGTVRRVVGLSVIASGPAVPVGDLCRIVGPACDARALVTGFREGECLLQPLSHVHGIRAGDAVVADGHGLEVPVGPALIGRVIDSLGQPLDGKGPILGQSRRDIDAQPPPAYGRPPIREVLETGIKAVDSLFTLGKGQRLGIFAGSGVGKSTLLGEMAKYAKADVNVIGLVGERGREVGEFIDEILGAEGMARSVVVIATSDRPAVERMAAASAAHTIAEFFRDGGLDVLLMMDSLTRFCQAARDVGLASGEPPSMRGYPPSAFSLLPRLLERSGISASGSITGLYTVLIEGDDENDPIADNARAILDGHLFLSRELAGRAIYPSIDPRLSVSRLVDVLATETDYRLALQVRELWSEYERVRDLVEVGAYAHGADPRVDRAIAVQSQLVDFIRQGLGERYSRAASLDLLRQILSEEAA
jgi:flagellum-specific ATP synthase